jgi:hypothetical protein
MAEARAGQMHLRTGNIHGVVEDIVRLPCGPLGHRPPQMGWLRPVGHTAGLRFDPRFRTCCGTSLEMSPYHWSATKTALMELLMPCTEMQELEAAYNSFAERRSVAVRPTSDRSKTRTGWARTRAAYVMQIHCQTCAICRFDS